MPTDYEVGVLVGLLIGEGHFGGDGRQPQVTLRMHERHEAMFRWLERTFPGGRLYGPYEHGGRRYYQWMARGAYLREVILPMLDEHVTPALDGYAHERLLGMREAYPNQLGRTSGRRAREQAFGPAADAAARVFAAIRGEGPQNEVRTTGASSAPLPGEEIGRSPRAPA